MSKTQPFDQIANARAMQAYVKAMLSNDPHTHRADVWENKFAPAIVAERETIRVEESGGGMCHMVTESLWSKHGWARLPVTYLDVRGDVISCGHLICALPDGSLLDATVDQFGEGDGVRVVKSNEPDYARYRPEFDGDVNPSTYSQEFMDFYWNGKADYDSQDELRATRGDGWWLEDKTKYIAYLRHQVSLGCGHYKDILKRLDAKQYSRPTMRA